MVRTKDPNKLRQDGEAHRIVRKRVSSLKPSPENTQLYRPVDDDPDIGKLADSIKKHGLCEPLIITMDKFIVSGHRRHAALQRIGPRRSQLAERPVRDGAVPSAL